MFGRIRPRAVALGTALVLIGSVAAFTGVQASAGASPAAKSPPGLDHFLCYEASPTAGFQIPGNLLLQNQFNKKGFVPKVSQEPLTHCNPVQKTVKKTVYPITNPNAHLLCFPITAATQPTFTVKVTNQFGNADLTTGQPTSLCLPTWKSLTGPPNQQPNQPPGLDHFVCYPVQYADTTRYKIPTNVTLQDQFASGPVKVQIGDPVRLCVPTTKIANGVVYKVTNPDAHLLCYSVSKTPLIPVVYDENQFGTDRINIEATTTVCLPSLKKILRAPPGE